MHTEEAVMPDWSLSNILPNLRQAAANVGQAAANVPGNFVQKLQDAAEYGPGNLQRAWEGAKNVWSQPVRDVLSNAGINALTGLGLAVEAPKQALYQEMNQFANQALGSTRPDVKEFKDVLTNRGMDPNALTTKGLGLAGDILTDPMTYALAGPSKLALESALGNVAATGLARKPALNEALKGTAVFREVQPTGAETWGGRLVRGRRAAEQEAADWLLRNEPAAQRTFANLPAQEAAVAREATETGLRSRFGTMAQAMAENPEAGAIYEALSNTVGLRPVVPVTPLPHEMLRHELTHAIINNAALSGNTAGLP